MKHPKLPLDSMEAFNDETFRRAVHYPVLVQTLELAIEDLRTCQKRFQDPNFGCVWEDAARDCNESAERIRAALDACEVG